jgi:hypothetical protein
VRLALRLERRLLQRCVQQVRLLQLMRQVSRRSRG